MDIKEVLNDLNKAFSDFKQEHKRQLEQMKNGINDSLQQIKVEKINDQLTNLQAQVDAFNTKLAAQEIAGGEQRLKDAEYSKAFTNYFRSGEVQAALSRGSDKDGGYLTPTEWDRTILDRLKLISPLRKICRQQTISIGSFSKLVNDRNTNSGWVGETDARLETNNAQLKTINYSIGEVYANPSATQSILDDSEINLEAWLASEIETDFAYQEGLAFIAGDGVNKPAGLLSYVAGGKLENTHPLGSIPLVNSGAANQITADGLIDLVFDLPSEVSGNASFVMNRLTHGVIRKLKDTTGQYLWQPSLQSEQPATLLGYPVIEVAAMPNVAANAKPILFGDFTRGYLILDRIGIRALRDPYTRKPYVSFYTTKRVGGGLLNPQVLRAQNIG